jgi:hypothetical protein
MASNDDDDISWRLIVEYMKTVEGRNHVIAGLEFLRRAIAHQQYHAAAEMLRDLLKAFEHLEQQQGDPSGEQDG